MSVENEVVPFTLPIIEDSPIQSVKKIVSAPMTLTRSVRGLAILAGATRSTSNIAASDEDESDTGSCSSAEAERRRKQLRKRQLITVGLAGVTTVAAGNNFYQATKAHKARRKQLTEGRMCTSEEKRLKDEGVKRDLISVGLAAVAVYNLRKGWGRMLDSRKEYREACEGKQEPRQRQGTGTGTGTGTGLGVDTSHPSAPRLTRRGHGDVDADFYFDA
ncbi:MAG: hypothetical protein M1833_006365 [Piccolia ochrophora]|nr:MAG: hypothetical protein M1833_006365 [Piccolia ochrophora]